MSKKILAFPFMSLFLAACVTINIYFPAAAAEDAARTIVRDVLGAEAGKQPAGKPSGDKSSAREDAGHTLLVWVGHTLEAVVSPAHAGQADININTAAISRIRTSMAGRQSTLAPFYKSGAIGFDGNGAVAVRDQGAVTLRDRNKMKKLVADENRDRSALYAEIARANGHPEWEADIRETFARVWVQEAPRGYWYQGDKGWMQK